MAAGPEIVAHLVRRMPTPSELGSFVYSVVLVRDGETLVGRIAGSSDGDWAARNGARLSIDEADHYFPALRGTLTSRGWAYDEAA